VNPGYPMAVKRRARELRAQGGSYKGIARELGVSRAAVVHWCDPDAAERHRRQKAAARAADPETARARDRERLRRRRENAKTRRRITALAQKRARDARAALRRQEQDAEMRGAPRGGVAEAYALVRRAARALDGVQAPTPEARRAVAAALDAVFEAEDAIVRASRSSAVAS
jgi:predicted transcriptional regulator